MSESSLNNCSPINSYLSLIVWCLRSLNHRGSLSGRLKDSASIFWGRLRSRLLNAVWGYKRGTTCEGSVGLSLVSYSNHAIELWSSVRVTTVSLDNYFCRAHFAWAYFTSLERLSGGRIKFTRTVNKLCIRTVFSKNHRLKLANCHKIHHQNLKVTAGLADNRIFTLTCSKSACRWCTAVTWASSGLSNQLAMN